MGSTCSLIPCETDMPIPVFPISVLDCWDKAISLQIKGLSATCMWWRWHMRTLMCMWVHDCVPLYCLFACEIACCNDISAKFLRQPTMHILCETSDCCPGMCIDWLHALLIRLDWPFQPTHLYLSILLFPSTSFPASFLIHLFLLSPSSSTHSSKNQWPLCFVLFSLLFPPVPPGDPNLVWWARVTFISAIHNFPNVFLWINYKLDHTVPDVVCECWLLLLARSVFWVIISAVYYFQILPLAYF